MNQTMLRRLEVLESQVVKRESTDPCSMYQELAMHGFDVPEPERGEDKKAWLSRVTLSTLEAVLEYGGRRNA